MYGLSIIYDGGILPSLLHLLYKFRIYSGTYFFETPVGYKSVGKGFSSALFRKSVTEVVNFEESKWTFHNLLLPPDGLKNQYSWSGRSILESPHIQLMKNLCSDNINESPAYIRYASRGTLDNRRRFTIDVKELKSIFEQRVDQISVQKRFDLFVYQPTNISDKLMILDGKHGAALAAMLSMPQSLRLHYVTSEPFRHPYFLLFYKTILSASTQEYSRNQQVIGKIIHG